MSRRYRVIYADPPWKHLGRYRSATKSRDPIYYPRMSTKEICDLPVKELADKPSVLFLWVTDGKLDKAMRVIRSWGFKYKTVAFVWLKLSAKSLRPVKIVSPWFMKSTEICLLGVKGKVHPHRLTTVDQLVIAPRTRHSEKPHQVRQRIELMFPTSSKIELFARKKYPGWDAWGNEVESDIEL